MSLPSRVLNIIGLALGVIGAGLIWKYGLPADVNRSGQARLVVNQVNQSEINKARRFDRKSGIGFALLIIGFILQAISNLF